MFGNSLRLPGVREEATCERADDIGWDMKQADRKEADESRMQYCRNDLTEECAETCCARGLARVWVEGDEGVMRDTGVVQEARVPDKSVQCFWIILRRETIYKPARSVWVKN